MAIDLHIRIWVVHRTHHPQYQHNCMVATVLLVLAAIVVIGFEWTASESSASLFALISF